MIATRGAQAYQQVDAQSRSPLQLVVMLYDGAIRFVGEAREAAGRGDVRARAHAVSRAMAIVAELQNTLNLQQGGAVAEELDRLYSYITARLIAVAASGDGSALAEVHKLLSTLRDGWMQAAAPAGAGPGRS